MRLFTCINIIFVVVPFTTWCQSRVLASECWINSSGSKICSNDPAGLRATWWFFFVLLLFVGVASGCFDAYWWPQEAASQELQTTGSEMGSDNNLGSLVHPLLGESNSNGVQQIHTSKPVYRYLDP
ncbi:uncharacterized protein PHALS_13104 [Plasmopara halstedii]|uniref:RxLR-like protein n=1 Tax=Plasmopara halstedii TaxID=4781 RepID=A0A0N7L5Z7_PLAHL|nr:uncharacterized protein PHALS_13104 [Plasmopara halstedii]CEG42867.1 hypothetical protein PHALS_13104 [Plasmopara halstedii]|eukprot:XP_024579236.1 hypothetical protein PHALS_13104 [Plasmopara halstedii]